MAIRPSPYFAVLLVFIHMVVAVVVYLTAIPMPFKLALILIAVLSLIYYLTRDVLLVLPNSWCEITLSTGNQTVVTRDGARLPFRIDNRIFISPYFIVLRGSLEGRYLMTSRVVFPDALASGEFRNLCVWLKFA